MDFIRAFYSSLKLISNWIELTLRENLKMIEKLWIVKL